MRLWNNYFSEKAKWWVRRKTKMPLKMIKENLLAGENLHEPPFLI
jgi:hypothetical protein